VPEEFAAPAGASIRKYRKISGLIFLGLAAKAGTALADPWFEQNAPGRQNGSRHT
jgi:hypothetical protein